MEFNIIDKEHTPCVNALKSVKEYIQSNKDVLASFWDYVYTLRHEGMVPVGLAANQASLNGKRFMYRVFAMAIPAMRLIIDPKIISYEGICEIKAEGCLTWPGLHIEAERYRKIIVSYYTIDGVFIDNMMIKGYHAQIWQHEINHLNGIEEKVVIQATESLVKDVGRNHLCPCDSGVKFKNCCLI